MNDSTKTATETGAATSHASGVVAIFIAPDRKVPMVPIQEVRALPGRGLEGDRYFIQRGTFSKAGKSGPDREVTLIEIETLESIKRDQGIELDLGESRRNIVTRGVPLNHWVGREFHVGEVKLRGMRLSEPCGYLERLTGKEGLMKALTHRGGLRAQILTEGMIRVGDPVHI